MNPKPVVEKVKVGPGDEEWRVRWGSGYPAILVGEPGWQSDLPGTDDWIEITSLKQHRDMVILGERSCGISDFLDWCCTRLAGSPWLFLRRGAWIPSLSQASREAEPLLAQAFSALEKMSSEESADRKADALIDWAGSLTMDVHLIMRDFTALESADSLVLARAFRLIRDSQRCPRLHILVGSSSESYLTDDLFSSFLPMTYRYRMRPLDSDSIGLIIEKLLGETEGTVEIVRKIEELVGGQPLLVRRIVQRLVGSKQDRESIGVRDVEKAFHQEKRSPPPVAEVWQRDLLSILSRHGELIEPMRSYVTGTTLGQGSMPPSDVERPLFIAGWLRKRWDGRWGIASEMHASLARPVLDDLHKEHGGRGLQNAPR